MLVGYATTFGISAYHHYRCEFESRLGEVYSIQHYCDKVCQGLAAGWWFSPDTPVSSINKTDRHHIAEILLRVVLNTIALSRL